MHAANQWPEDSLPGSAEPAAGGFQQRLIRFMLMFPMVSIFVLIEVSLHQLTFDGVKAGAEDAGPNQDTEDGGDDSY
jgi:hypothetical protein